MKCKGKGWLCCGCVGAVIAALTLGWGVVKDLRSAPPAPTPPASPSDQAPVANASTPSARRVAADDRPAPAADPTPSPDVAQIRQRLDTLDKLLNEEKRAREEERKAREQAEAREKAFRDEAQRLRDARARQDAARWDTSSPPDTRQAAQPQYTVVFRHLTVVKEPEWIHNDPQQAEYYGRSLVELGLPQMVQGRPVVAHYPSGWSSVAFEQSSEWRRASFPDAGTAEIHAAVLKDLGFECRVEDGGVREQGAQLPTPSPNPPPRR